MTFAKYPIGGSGTGGVETVADAAARALLVPDHGDLVVQLDTNELYEYNGTSWAVIADRTYNDPIVNADISASAAIDRSKLASGTASHVLINDGTGVMSSEATLAKSRGGTGADNTNVTFPSTGTLATLAGAEALTNKTFDADLNTVSNIDNGDIKTGAAIERAKLASGTASHVVINDGTGAFSSEATLAKSRGGTGADNTSVTFPASGTIVTEAGSQALTNKTFDADLNTVSNIDNADIKVGAAIDRAKLDSGTASHVIINDGSGVMSSEAQLATSRGGTGVNSTATFPSSGVVVTEAGTQTLTNKTLTAPIISTISNTGTVTLPTATDTLVGRSTTDTLLNKTVVSSTAAITGALALPSGTTADRSGLTTTGMVRHNTSINEFEGYSNGAWQPIGSGLNEQPVKNYLKTYALAAIAPGTLSTLASTTSNLVSLTAFYADSTSGSSALSQSSDTTLRGSFNYLTATGTSDSAGARFVQFPAFALEGSDLGKPISLSFDVSGVTTDGNWDVVVVRYNSSGTHQSIISVAGNASSGTTPPSAKLPTGTTTFNGFFVPDSTTAGDLYAVRLRSLANTVQIRVDNLFCGQQPIRTGGSTTDPQSYTPDLSFSWGTATNINLQWWRHGTTLFVVGRFNAGTIPASSGTRVPLPNGYVIGSISSSANSPVGRWERYTTSANAQKQGVVLAKAGEAYVTFGGDDYALTQGWEDSRNSSGIFANGELVGIQFQVPITGWSSNVTMADRSVEEYAFNSDVTSTASVTTTGFASGIDGVLFSSAWAVGTGYIRTVEFSQPIQPTDSIVVEIKNNNRNWVPATAFYPSIRQGANAFGLQWYLSGTSPTTRVVVEFGAGGRYPSNATYAGNGAPWSDENGAGGRWRVRKVSAGAQVGYPIASSNIILQDTISVLTGATTLSANATNVRYICNSGSAFTVTLPAVASVSDGTIFRFKNIGAGVVTLDGNASETIDGATTLAMSQYVSIDLIEYNGAWYVL